jgi:hypothetical protein
VVGANFHESNLFLSTLETRNPLLFAGTQNRKLSDCESQDSELRECRLDHSLSTAARSRGFVLFALRRKYKIGLAYIADSALPIALERSWVPDASATGLAENGMHSQRRGRLLL